MGETVKTIREMLERSAVKYKDTPYLRYERDDVVYDISFTRFAELCRIIGAFANEQRAKLGRQVKAGLFGSSSVHYISTLVGIMGSGNVAVPLDYQMDLTHLADCLNRSDVDILFYDWEYEPIVSDVKALCPKITAYYSLQSVKKTPCLNDILRDVK